MNPALLFIIAFLAIFTQSLAGFGLALVSMPLLVGLVSVKVAAPLVALIALTAEIVLLIRYREAFDLRAVARLSVASLMAIPVGVWIAHRADEQVILTLLGLIVTGYALYALLNLHLPKISRPRWAYGFGFAAGLLSGAYNMPGPAVVIYGHCRRWIPSEFKSNLQGFFLLNSLMVIAAHMVEQSYTAQVWQCYWVSLPGVILGLVVGLSLDRYINPALFRKLVLILLVVLGLTLVF